MIVIAVGEAVKSPLLSFRNQSFVFRLSTLALSL